MRVLVVHAHPDPTSFNRALCDVAVRTLSVRHEVTLIDLYGEGFRVAMSADERGAYETDAPICADEVSRSAELIRATEAVVFVYPTWWFGPPAILKGWLERVLVPGVGFELHADSNKVVSGLRRIRRIGAVTTYGSSRRNVLLMTDGGRRIVMRCLRILASPRCRRTWLGLYAMDTSTEADRAAFLRRVEEKFAKW
jgi:NAD(P)H dehydrogenase (quinone)